MIEKYKELYEERVAIMTIDGGIAEDKAKAMAMQEVKDLFIKNNNLSLSNGKTYAALSRFEKQILDS